MVDYWLTVFLLARFGLLGLVDFVLAVVFYLLFVCFILWVDFETLCSLF